MCPVLRGSTVLMLSLGLFTECTVHTQWRIHDAILPLFSSDLRATMMESLVPGTNLNEEKPLYFSNGWRTQKPHA